MYLFCHAKHAPFKKIKINEKKNREPTDEYSFSKRRTHVFLFMCVILFYFISFFLSQFYIPYLRCFPFAHMSFHLIFFFLSFLFFFYSSFMLKFIFNVGDLAMALSRAYSSSSLNIFEFSIMLYGS